MCEFPTRVISQTPALESSILSLPRWVSHNFESVGGGVGGGATEGIVKGCGTGDTVKLYGEITSGQHLTQIIGVL